MLVRPLFGGVLVLGVAVRDRAVRLHAHPAGHGTESEPGHQAATLRASARYLRILPGALLAALVPGGATRDRVLSESLVVVVMRTALLGGTGDIVTWGILRLLCGLASAGTFVLAWDLVLGLLTGSAAPHATATTKGARCS